MARYETVTPGIVVSDGAYSLGPKHNQDMPDCFRRPGGVYSGLDACLVMLVYPNAFKRYIGHDAAWAEEYIKAVNTAQMFYPEALARFTAEGVE